MSRMKLFRREIRTPDGTRGMFWLLPFDGDGKGRHHFNDHGHAVNFVRYLFSQSNAHPRTPGTARNLFRIHAKDGSLSAQAYNDDPARYLANFMVSGLFPAREAHRQLYDDGCYPLFTFRQAGGPFVSNMLRRSVDTGALELHHPLMKYLPAYLAQNGHDWNADAGRLAGLIGNAERLIDFDHITDADLLQRSEAMLQSVVRGLMGEEEKVVMTVAHRDQEDHNPVYHIHRLLRF